MLFFNFKANFFCTHRVGIYKKVPRTHNNASYLHNNDNFYFNITVVHDPYYWNQAKYSSYPPSVVSHYLNACVK